MMFLFHFGAKRKTLSLLFVSSIVNEVIMTISIFKKNAKQIIPPPLLEVFVHEKLLPLLSFFACFCFVSWFLLDLHFCVFKIFS